MGSEMCIRDSNYVTFLNRKKMVTTEENGKQNMFGKEPQVQVIEEKDWKEAELLNGRLAMIGIIAGIGAVATTGQILPGIF